MKQKTHKAVSKRIKVTKNGKIVKRKAGQDHFNARESGKVRRNKRSDVKLGKQVKKAIKTFLPYSK
jgi:large subunit ribosomal protein L35